jgi:hypothetical protein
MVKHSIGKESSMSVKDGRLEIALAIARTSDLVTVDDSTQPFTVDPDDLFDWPFNDNRVGIDDGQMSIFKAELEKLLPEIKGDIDGIPENSNILIKDVVKTIRDALFKNSGS